MRMVMLSCMRSIDPLSRSRDRKCHRPSTRPHLEIFSNTGSPFDPIHPDRRTTLNGPQPTVTQPSAQAHSNTYANRMPMTNADTTAYPNDHSTMPRADSTCSNRPRPRRD